MIPPTRYRNIVAYPCLISNLHTLNSIPYLFHIYSSFLFLCKHKSPSFEQFNDTKQSLKRGEKSQNGAAPIHRSRLKKRKNKTTDPMNCFIFKHFLNFALYQIVVRNAICPVSVISHLYLSALSNNPCPLLFLLPSALSA